MFQFPGFASNPLCIQGLIPSFDNRKSEAGNPRVLPQSLPASKFQLSKVGFPIRKSAGQRLFAPHHSLSQRTTSFIASYRQGIHQMPLGHLIALISNAHPFGRMLGSGESVSISPVLGTDRRCRKTRIRDKPKHKLRSSGSWLLRAARTDVRRLRPIPSSRCR